MNNAFSNEYFEEATSLIRAMFSYGFKTNEFLGGVVMTGVLQISKSNILSGLNILVVNSVVSGSGYSEAFGFTQAEVDEMLGYYGLSYRRGDLRDWYDGYCIRDTYVYNPYSVTNAVRSFRLSSSAECESYWVDTGGTKLLKDMLASCKGNRGLKSVFDNLLDGQGVEAGYTTSVAYPDILESPETVTGTLLLSGYLTKEGTRLRIPDREVQEGFSALCGWYNRDVDESALLELVQAYVDGRVEDAKDIPGRYFEETLRARDLNRGENNYH